MKTENLLLGENSHHLTEDKAEWLESHQELKSFYPTDAMKKCGIVEIYDLTNCEKQSYFYGNIVVVLANGSYIDWDIKRDDIQIECEYLLNKKLNKQ